MTLADRLRMGRRPLALAVLAGAMAALGQAPFGLWWLSLAGFALIFMVLRDAQDLRRAGWIGWCAGTGYFALSLFWIVEPFLIDIPRHGWMAPFALIGMSGGLALFWGAAAMATRALGNRALAWIAAFSAAEILRSYVLTGFPWALIGHIWVDTPVAQLAALAGHHGLTLLALLAAAGLVQLASPARRWAGAVAVTFVCLAAFWGNMTLQDAALPTAQLSDRPVIRMVQPNVPQHQKWDRALMPVFFQRQVAFTAAVNEQSVQPRPDVVIWPETALSVLLENAGPALDIVSDAAGDVPVVMGVQRFVGQRTFNSAILMDGDGFLRDVYDKHQLVPFGEYMPFGEIAARFGIHGLAASRGGGFSPGPGARLMDLGAVGRALPLICYEAVFPQFIGSAPDRPDFLMQLTNDAWFGAISGPYQHLAQARLRAIEQGLPMVRVANTGVSAMIDPWGRITAQIALGTEGWRDAALPAARSPTPYARSGEWPVLAFVAGLVLLLGGHRALIGAKSRKDAGNSD